MLPPLRHHPPPRPNDNQTFHLVKGDEAKIYVMFTANPKPTSIKWIVQKTNNTGGNQTDNQSTSTNESTSNVITIELPSTEDRSRYTLYNLTEQSQTLYVANLTIANISNSDHWNIYSLEVANSMGIQRYNFDINITDVTSTAAPPTSST
jgi:hypothetical protein